MLEIILLAFFLPIFPLSSLFVILYQRIESVYIRCLILLIWPQVGLLIVSNLSEPIPDWFVIWAMGSALLYAFRSLVVRELHHWVSFIAVSSWSVYWLLIPQTTALSLVLLGVSLPLAMLSILSREIDRQHVSIYVGVISGLAHGKPKLAGLLTVTLLMLIGTPLAPSFFNFLTLIAQQLSHSMTLTLLLIFIWFFISWSGMRIYQQLMTGEYKESIESDISINRSLIYSLAVMAIVLFGLFYGGALL